ncbi:MAG: alpha/beta hydrolase [Alphaproteobacteria bacterium]|nr:alpha/beta hydrolase [Alphaproteobacteria bacterium]MBV9694930.1 alpha/beta hydrolase [Alphaproteobacteria bacterium]
MRPFLALFLALLVSGCVGDKAELVHSVWRPADGAAVERTVWYATDRAADKDWPGGFGKHWSDALSCGRTVAVLPAMSLVGEDISTGHLKPAAQAPLACADLDAFAARLAGEAHAKNCNEVLIYVHGFNTLFDGAVLRAGQLANDAQMPCPALAFSWSSEGEVGRYIADIEHSAYAVPEFEALLRGLAKSGMHVDILGHSMGARIALSALASMARHREPPPDDFVGELILAAADVGADPVNDDFAHLLGDARPFVHRITVYASSGDAVLAVSAVAHGDVARAGHRPLGDRALAAAGPDHAVDIVDATDAPAELLGHSYFGLSYEAVSDIALVLHGATVAQRLSKIDGWPVTLVCRPVEGESGCDPRLPHYVLYVDPARRPDFFVRLVRRLVPLLPRIELAPLNPSGE